MENRKPEENLDEENRYLKAQKRVKEIKSFYTHLITYVAVNDEDAVNAFQILSQQEGIIPALESAHAIAYAIKLAKEMLPEQTIIVNLSGRGDKDLNTVKKYLTGVTE